MIILIIIIIIIIITRHAIKRHIAMLIYEYINIAIHHFIYHSSGKSDRGGEGSGRSHDPGAW